MLRWCGIISTTFFLACECCPELLMKLFSHDEEIIGIGSAYLRIAGWSYLITGVSGGMGAAALIGLKTQL